MALSNKYLIFFFLVFLLFIALRLPGINLPYHQDEVKWVVNSANGSSGMGHPPLSGIIFSLGAKLIGSSSFRFLPFFFGVANLFLLFYLVNFIFGQKEAWWSAFLFSVGFYSILGSLMVDTDGQVLPFFFLLTLISYFKWRSEPIFTKKNVWWGIAMAVAIAAGLSVKLSFILVVVALGMDYLYDQRHLLTRKLIISSAIALAIFLFLGLMLLKSGAAIGAHNSSRILVHIKDFIKFSGRNYFQTLFQVVKAVLYSSPLLILPVALLSGVELKKLKSLILFIFFSVVFYTILFDFSSGALDKYFEFVIVPLSILSGVAISRFVSWRSLKDFKAIVSGTGLLLVTLLLQFIKQSVPPLYPKNEWISRIVHLKWNFLMPFTGGSGPVGFYVSWLFMAVAWIVSLVLIVLAVKNKAWTGRLVLILVILGLGYNFVFAEEYLFGKINGSPNVLLSDSLNFIKDNHNIKTVMTYNDIGDYYLSKMGKYERRIYAAPKFESGYVDILNNFKSYYLVVEIPRLSPLSIYSKFFASCKSEFTEVSGAVTANVYNCKKAISLKQSDVKL